MKIKICGLKRREDIEVVNQVMPDYIGFVFARSKRQVSMEEAAALKKHVRPEIKTVGVFVNEDINQIIRLCKHNIIDVIQLHGDEEEKEINDIRSKVSNPIIKAIRVHAMEDIKKAKDYTADFLLFDAYHQDQYGGSGLTFDWSMVNNIKLPFFLAGGINTNNIVMAMDRCNPYGIDVSSGVETEGVKDRDKIVEIVSKLRNYNYSDRT